MIAETKYEVVAVVINKEDKERKTFLTTPLSPLSQELTRLKDTGKRMNSFIIILRKRQIGTSAYKFRSSLPEDWDCNSPI